MNFRWIVSLLPVVLIHHVTGHGRLIEPPSRSSMWRYGFINPPNYNDNQLFCGGFSIQWGKNGGKCGVCGDPYEGPHDNEPGGKYAKGNIVAKYDAGATIEVVVHLTANHKGTFEFKLCRNDDPSKKVTQECFDKNILRSVKGTTKLIIEQDIPKYQKFQMQLPAGLTCTACVLQWKYNTGNSWGKDAVTGKGCIGCGPQEQFYACSDIAIGHPEVKLGPKKGGQVEVPAGDVDETKWEDAIKEQEEKAKLNTCCPCNTSSSTRTRGSIVPVLLGHLGMFCLFKMGISF